MALDQDQAVGSLHDPLAAQVALDPAAGKLPDAGPDRLALGRWPPRA